jgi:hypothetical protein
MNLPFLGNLSAGKFRKPITFLYKTFYFGLVAFLLFVISLNFNFLWLFGKLPGVDDLDNPKSEIASEIISSDGKVIGKFFFENRSPLTYQEISPYFIDALIATEDVRYTKHSGVDARSILRAVTGVLTFNKKGGGSTISQQLAKNLFKLRQDEGYEGLLYKIPVVRTLVIKSKEWVTAIKLERRYTKKEILVMYLNTIEFSSGAYGLKSATKTYFKKDPQNLNKEEAALRNIKEFHVDSNARDALVKEIMEKGEVTRPRIMFKNAKGDKFEVGLNVIAQRDDNGKVVSYQGIVHNITEAIRQKELEAISQLAGCFADDLASPLSVILIGIETIKTFLADIEKMTEKLSNPEEVKDLEEIIYEMRYNVSDINYFINEVMIAVNDIKDRLKEIRDQYWNLKKVSDGSGGIIYERGSKNN